MTLSMLRVAWIVFSNSGQRTTTSKGPQGAEHLGRRPEEQSDLGEAGVRKW